MTRLPGPDLRCPACGNEIRVAAASERITGLAFGIPAAVLLTAAALGYPWGLVRLDIGALGIVAILAFPYLACCERADGG